MPAVDLGEPRLEYRPLPATPMAIALLIITASVTLVGLPLAWINRMPGELLGLWVAPPLLVTLAILLDRPGPLRLYEKGLELPLPLRRRLLGARTAYAYEEVVNVYPRLYYVSGALLSPFAASAGTVEHLGLGLEMADGTEAILKFTPGVPHFAQGEDRGYTLVASELRSIFRARGRPWVTEVEEYGEEEIRAMKREAARPLMPFFVIVAAFFAPAVLLPTLHQLLLSLGATVGALELALLLGVGLSPTVVMLLTSWARSRRRHRYLKEISKVTERRREAERST